MHRLFLPVLHFNTNCSQCWESIKSLKFYRIWNLHWEATHDHLLLKEFTTQGGNGENDFKLFINCFTTLTGIFHSYWDDSSAGEGLQSLGLFEQRGVLIVPHWLRHGTSIFVVSSEGSAHVVTSYNKQGIQGVWYDPDSQMWRGGGLLYNF
jgi:hypothetical protein